MGDSGSPSERLRRFLQGEESCWGSHPIAGKVGGVGICLSSQKEQLTAHCVSSLSVGLYAVSAGKKSHDLELRQEGIEGITLLLGLLFLCRLH